MTRTCALTLGLLFIGFGGLQSSRPLAGQAGGFTTLLDGSTLKGWAIVGDANWEVVDGAVCGVTASAAMNIAVGVTRRSAVPAASAVVGPLSRTWCS